MPKLAKDARNERRREILSAALRCFARTGYYATAMADVATDAGVSKGTPYLYFPNKEALYVALCEEWNRGLAARIEAAIGALSDLEQQSPKRVLRAVAAEVGAHVVDHTEACRVLMDSHALAGFHPTVATAVNAADNATRQQIEELIQRGIAIGEWPADTDASLQARLFTATLHGLMVQWHQDPGSFSWSAAADLITNGGLR